MPGEKRRGETVQHKQTVAHPMTLFSRGASRFLALVARKCHTRCVNSLTRRSPSCGAEQRPRRRRQCSSLLRARRRPRRPIQTHHLQVVHLRPLPRQARVQHRQQKHRRERLSRLAPLRLRPRARPRNQSQREARWVRQQRAQGTTLRSPLPTLGACRPTRAPTCCSDAMCQ